LVIHGGIYFCPKGYHIYLSRWKFSQQACQAMTWNLRRVHSSWKRPEAKSLPIVPEAGAESFDRASFQAIWIRCIRHLEVQVVRKMEDGKGRRYFQNSVRVCCRRYSETPFGRIALCFVGVRQQLIFWRLRLRKRPFGIK
jgi:hypothetical protein